jgi:hypothetical protein
LKKKSNGSVTETQTEKHLNKDKAGHPLFMRKREMIKDALETYQRGVSVIKNRAIPLINYNK